MEARQLYGEDNEHDQDDDYDYQDCHDMSEGSPSLDAHLWQAPENPD